MKKVSKYILTVFTFFLLVGCTNNVKVGSKTDTTEKVIERTIALYNESAKADLKRNQVNVEIWDYDFNSENGRLLVVMLRWNENNAVKNYILGYEYNDLDDKPITTTATYSQVKELYNNNSDKVKLIYQEENVKLVNE